MRRSCVITLEAPPCALVAKEIVRSTNLALRQKGSVYF